MPYTADPKVCDCGTRITAGNRSEIFDMCQTCYDYWGEVNTHNDYGHDRILEVIASGEELADWMSIDEVEATKTCPICKGMPEPGKREKKGTYTQDHTNSKSHKAHNHPLTREYRSLCRKALATTGFPLSLGNDDE